MAAGLWSNMFAVYPMAYFPKIPFINVWKFLSSISLFDALSVNSVQHSLQDLMYKLHYRERHAGRILIYTSNKLI